MRGRCTVCTCDHTDRVASPPAPGHLPARASSRKQLAVWPVLAGVVPILRCQALLPNLKDGHVRPKRLPKRFLRHLLHLGSRNARLRLEKEKRLVTENLRPPHSHLHSPALAALAAWHLHQSAHIVLQAVAVSLCPPSASCWRSSVYPSGTLPSPSELSSSGFSCSSFRGRCLKKNDIFL